MESLKRIEPIHFVFVLFIRLNSIMNNIEILNYTYTLDGNPSKTLRPTSRGISVINFK